MTLLLLKDFGGNSANGTEFIIPLGCTWLRATLTGGGGAGDYGRDNHGAGGGGRGAVGEKIIMGDLGGKVITIHTGVGGYAPTVESFGNVGTQSSITFDNGWQLIAGGGYRAEGQIAGHGGNMAQDGIRPAYIIKQSEHNLGSEGGQFGLLNRGGRGGGQGDTGGGGYGGNPGELGIGGTAGYVNIQFFS